MSHEPHVSAAGELLRYASAHWPFIAGLSATIVGAFAMAKRRMLSPYATKAEMMECQKGLRVYINDQHRVLENRLSEQHSTLNSHVQHNQEQLWNSLNELRHDSEERHNQVMTLLVQLGRD